MKWGTTMKQNDVVDTKIINKKMISHSSSKNFKTKLG